MSTTLCTTTAVFHPHPNYGAHLLDGRYPDPDDGLDADELPLVVDDRFADDDRCGVDVVYAGPYCCEV